MWEATGEVAVVMMHCSWKATGAAAGGCSPLARVGRVASSAEVGEAVRQLAPLAEVEVEAGQHQHLNEVAEEVQH